MQRDTILETYMCMKCGKKIKLPIEETNHKKEIKRECPDCKFMWFWRKDYNHKCWNCSAPINSKECASDNQFGYICNNCGESLKGYFKKKIEDQLKKQKSPAM